MRHAPLLIGPALLCALSIFGGLGMSVIVGLSGTEILRSYADVSLIMTVLGILIWAVIPWLRPFDRRSVGPISAALVTIRERALLLIIPLALLPVFLTGFTVMKIAVPLVTGYHFDRFWTDADAIVFGTDPWRITHLFIGPRGSDFLTTVYTLVWGLALTLVAPIYTMSGNPERVARAFSALMATWLFGGIVGTLLFSSVGPVFVGLVDSSLVLRFAPLHTSLAEVLPADGAILLSQEYLRRNFGVYEVFRAGGISAMPSMHLAVCAWLILLSGKSLWRFPAIVLWILIWIGSVHFGYHYALDGIIGSFIAFACWKVCMTGFGDQRIVAPLPLPVAPIADGIVTT